MASAITNYPCLKCNKEVVSDAVECSICEKWCHRACGKLSIKKLRELSESDQYWFCLECSAIFPFFNITDEEFDLLNSQFDLDTQVYELYKKCLIYDNEIKMFRDYNSSDFENNSDPEASFFNNYDNECQYYTESQLVSRMSNTEGFSIIHFNCRSIKSTFSEINNFIDNIDKKN